ncbi:hypothetical protein [Mycobacterium sp. SMC-14]
MPGGSGEWRRAAAAENAIMWAKLDARPPIVALGSAAAVGLLNYGD